MSNIPKLLITTVNDDQKQSYLSIKKSKSKKIKPLQITSEFTKSRTEYYSTRRNLTSLNMIFSGQFSSNFNKYKKRSKTNIMTQSTFKLPFWNNSTLTKCVDDENKSIQSKLKEYDKFALIK